MGMWFHEKPVIHTEKVLQGILYRQFAGACIYMAPNIHHQLGEADLLIVRRSEYAEEFEIKISTSDLKADFHKVRKHQQYHLRRNNQNTRRYMMPNKFSYVLGNRVSYKNSDFPPYAGIYVAKQHTLRCIKQPEFIHKKKYKWEKKIAASCGFRLVHYFTQEYT